MYIFICLQYTESHCVCKCNSVPGACSPPCLPACLLGHRLHGAGEIPGPMYLTKAKDQRSASIFPQHCLWAHGFLFFLFLERAKIIIQNFLLNSYFRFCCWQSKKKSLSLFFLFFLDYAGSVGKHKACQPGCASAAGKRGSGFCYILTEKARFPLNESFVS